MRQRGFTIVELLIVLVIMGIVMAAATPMFRTFRLGLIQQQACWQVIQDLRAARQMAITKHTPVVIVFGNGITTTNITSYRVHADLDNDRVMDAGELVVNNTMPAGSRFSRVSLTPTDTLVFDISGTLKSGYRGGRLVVQAPGSSGLRDTIMVSIAGIPYKR